MTKDIKHMTAGRILIGAGIMALLLFAGSGAAAQSDTNKMETKALHPDLGKDPHPFATAEDMYKTAEKRTYDAIAEGWTSAVEEKIREGKPLEDDVLWKALLALNPFRETTQIQGMVPGWAAAAARALKAKTVTAAPDASFRAANTDYQEGRFPQAEAGYIAQLRVSPFHHDARSNLALTEIRLNNDLAAQLELETLRKLEPGYAPALINLTVVYERLGQRERAQAASREAEGMAKEIPATVYNLAWFESQGPNLAAAQKSLETIMEQGGPVSPYRKLRLLNSRILNARAAGGKGQKVSLAQEPGGKKVGFWKRGLAGVTGAKKTWWGYALAAVIFLLLSIFLIFICGAAGSSARKKGKAAFWLFVVLGGLFFLLFWGNEKFGWLIVYVIIAGAISAVASEQM